MRDHSFYRVFVAAAFAAVFVMTAAGSAHALSKLEEKCSSQLGKAASKIAKIASNEISKCRDADINGKAVGACPNAENTAKITSIADKLISKAVQFCQSVCSASTSVPCITNSTCPPLATGANEQCTAGPANDRFDMLNIGFPGPICEGIIGNPVLVPEDIGECTNSVTQLAIGNLIDAVYGSITNGAAGTQAGKCLSAMSKGARKLTATTVKQVAKCRDLIGAGKLSGDPVQCATSDPKTSGKIAKIANKIRKLVQAKCVTEDLAELDICLAGVGGIATLTEAEDCLIAASQEAGDSALSPGERIYSSITVIDGAYPAEAACGDGIANQLPNSNLILGEECDGDDDAACPGECLPPGDLFECTCSDRLRLRTLANARFNDLRTDSDAGWTGNSHDQTVSDLSGMIMDMTACDCDEFTDADCTGTSGDPICTATGTQLPRCSWDVAGTVTRCDAQGGDVDTVDESEDCYVCDDFSANSGAFCEDANDCDSQCYDAGGTPTGACTEQGDCGIDEVCRGLCDKSQTCVITPNGAPLPVSAAGAAICTTNTFLTSLTGTRNVVTGEHELFFQISSKQHLGENTERPCPVCGGFCVGGSKNNQVCEGRCELSSDPCRFDSDCPGSETCERTSPDCPGGFCQLDLICGATDHTQILGDSCAVEYTHPFFGSMSNDCPPLPSKNITGDLGFIVNHTPTTSETLTIPFAVPCDPPFNHLDCSCPGDGGQPSRPNGCQPACDAAGPGFGIGCADGAGGTGEHTRCAGGTEAGAICDEDGDCGGGTCSANPMHCTGDLAFDRHACTSDLQCGTGTCVDACSGGRCTLLCVPQMGDPEDGICAAAIPQYACENTTFITCSQGTAESSCAATCSVSLGACFNDGDCPMGESCQGSCAVAKNCEAGSDGILGTGDDRVGAGNCVALERSCIQDPVVIEGGDTLNGNGSPTDNMRVSFWCFGKTINPGVNATAGFGGPGVLREAGMNVVNRASTP